MQDVGLAPIPAILLADELIQRIPPILIGGGRLGRYWRPRDHLTPEKAVQIGGRFVRQHAAGDEYLGRTVVVEIVAAGSPRPAAEIDMLRSCRVLERTIP